MLIVFDRLVILESIVCLSSVVLILTPHLSPILANSVVDRSYYRYYYYFDVVYE